MTWREQLIGGQTPNGGVLAIVLAQSDRRATVITEYDARGLTVYRFEWRLRGPDEPGDGQPVELEITDWDGQLVERRSVSALPPPRLGRATLARWVRLPDE